MGTHAVKLKVFDSKVWWFLTPRGGETRLRIHASLMSEERANEVARIVVEDNPGVVLAAKVVKMWKDA
jgi:hypothetical protein